MKKFFGIVTAAVLVGGLSAFSIGGLQASPGGGPSTPAAAPSSATGLPYCKAPLWCWY